MCSGGCSGASCGANGRRFSGGRILRASRSLTLLPLCARAVSRVDRADRNAALRAMLVGLAVMQSVAAVWIGTDVHPRRRAASEAWAHRFWEWPASADMRGHAGVAQSVPWHG